MISRSSPNQLPFNKVNPERYIHYDPTDRIYLQEFDFDGDRHRRGRSSKLDLSLVESTKKRAQ